MNLEAYLERIGLGGVPEPGLDEVHRAHATHISFENFDPYSGRPVSLEPADLEDKMVTRRRGGYCFEQNTLLAAALGSLGLEVDPMLARVRLGPEGSPRPLNHLLLRVRATGAAPGWPTSASAVAGCSTRCPSSSRPRPSSRAGATGWCRTGRNG